ncbi:MAG TPA: tetratricopeptide repeat protein [Polyangiaceae bacterium]|nr:tetratricopeptide repeat protein [Polyangiaceae bacterium]
MSPPDSTREVATEDFLYHLYRGSELLQDNRILEAKEELEQALTMQPADAKGQDLLGAVYFRLGLYPRAIQIYEGLEGQFPGDVSIKVNLALCYLKTGQPEPARRVLRDVVHINPEHKRAWGYLGLALQKLGELEQAQIAFERGGRPMMARKVTEFRRSLAPPDSSPPELAQSVRDMADTAFSELDTGELRFALAEAGSPAAGEGQWHTLEIGGTSKSKPPPKSPFTKTLPPPWMGGLEPSLELGSVPAPSISFAAPPVPRMAPVSEAPPVASPVERGTTSRLPVTRSDEGPAPPVPLLPPVGSVRVEVLPSGVVVVHLAEGADRAFAARLDALRVVSGAATSRVLHRRARDAETSEVLGDTESPFIRMAGDVQLVLGARPNRRLSVLTVDQGLAFVREDLLVGFELALQYENGRVPLEAPLEGGDETHVVQLRGSGAFVLDAPGELASLPSRTERPLIARREWIVGWFGRLVARALSSTEAPGGHRGLVGFWGEGTVLVCVA